MATQTDPAPPADASAAPAPAVAVYEYLDEIPHKYCFHDGTVITPNKGDVCTIPYDPGDKRWQPSKAKVTRWPDNDPKQAEKNAAQQAAERDEIHRAAAAALETGKA